MEKEVKKLQESVKWILQQLEIHFDGTPQQAHVDATPMVQQRADNDVWRWFDHVTRCYARTQ